MAQVLSPTLQNIQLCAQSLRAGQLVAMPTETVYGLAGNALDPSVVAQIFAVKNRPTFDPLIIHVAPFDTPQETAETWLEKSELIQLSSLPTPTRLWLPDFLRKLWPGPLTVIFPKSALVPDLVTSGLPNVAIRMPAHPIAQELLKAAALPLAAPSANRFGRISPTNAQAVASELGDKLNWILDGGPCEVGVESTVILLESDGSVSILRSGGTTLQSLKDALPATILLRTASTHLDPKTGAQLAPGNLASHYSPVKPMQLVEYGFTTHESNRLSLIQNLKGKRVSILGYDRPIENAIAPLRALGATDFVLGPSLVLCREQFGNAQVAARNLFSDMRTLDQSESHLILAELPPRAAALGGLESAITDRLRRAASSS